MGSTLLLRKRLLPKGEKKTGSLTSTGKCNNKVQSASAAVILNNSSFADGKTHDMSFLQFISSIPRDFNKSKALPDAGLELLMTKDVVIRNDTIFFVAHSLAHTNYYMRIFHYLYVIGFGSGYSR